MDKGTSRSNEPRNCRNIGIPLTHTLPVFGHSSTRSEMIAKVAVRGENLLDKTTLTVAVNDSRKSRVVNERDGSRSIDKLA